MYVPTGRPIRDKSNGSHVVTLLISIRMYNNVRKYRHIFHIITVNFTPPLNSMDSIAEFNGCTHGIKT